MYICLYVFLYIIKNKHICIFDNCVLHTVLLNLQKKNIKYYS